MKKIQRENKMQLVADIQHFIKKTTDCEIGNLATEELLDYVMDKVAPIFYNQALADARKVIHNQMEALGEELYVLEAPQDHNK